MNVVGMVGIPSAQPPPQQQPQQQPQQPQALDNISKIKSLISPLRESLSVCIKYIEFKIFIYLWY